jgi:SAM-dependent methyltransferase
MVQMIDQQDQRIGEFYDALAADYDHMTGFEKRIVSLRPFFRLLVEQYGIATAIDAGSGTGFHSILLAMLGVKVTAVDLSREMLRVVKRHASEKKVSVDTLQCSFSELPDSSRTRVDALFCMGNTLAHSLSEGELASTLAGFRATVKNGGLIFVQMLNYDRILRDRQRVQNTRESDGKTFVRFYDFEEDHLVFNILTVEQRDGTSHQDLKSVPLKGWRSIEMVRALEGAGFQNIETFGGISKEPFRPKTSSDLVMLARTSA